MDIFGNNINEPEIICRGMRQSKGMALKLGVQQIQIQYHAKFMDPAGFDNSGSGTVPDME